MCYTQEFLHLLQGRPELVPALLAARAPVLADCLTFCRAGGTLNLDTLLFRSRGVPAR